MNATLGFLTRIGCGFAVVLLTGCAQYTTHEYKPVSWKVEPDHVLEIETRSDFGGGSVEIPFTYYHEKGGDFVKLVVHLKHRDHTGYHRSAKPAGRKGINSSSILAFAYRLDDEDWVPLIAKENPVNTNFWKVPNPIPYRRGAKVDLRIRFEMNGKEYAFTGKSKATSDTEYWPLAVRMYQD